MLAQFRTFFQSAWANITACIPQMLFGHAPAQAVQHWSPHITHRFQMEWKSHSNF